MFHHSITLSYDLCNLTTYSTTQSHCPTFLFFYFICSFFKIQWKSAKFWGWFPLKGKSHKTFEFVLSTKVLFCKFWFFADFVCPFGLQSSSLPPPHLCAPYSMFTVSFHKYFVLQICYYFDYFFKFFLAVYIYYFSIELPCTENFVT
jgi:hypothetical protein